MKVDEAGGASGTRVHWAGRYERQRTGAEAIRKVPKTRAAETSRGGFGCRAVVTDGAYHNHVLLRFSDERGPEPMNKGE